MKKGVIEMQVLKELNPEIRITFPNGIVPKEYFKKREGLYVYDSFTDKVLTKAEPIETCAEYAIESFELLEDVTDKQIELSLGNKNVFGESDVCAAIAYLIDAQPKGEEGILLTNGYWNLFYTSACVVSVYWNGDGWNVNAWRRDDNEWNAGGRVFSPQLTLEI